MIVTEEEAKTKRCQEGYAASPGASLTPATDFTVMHEAIPAAMMSTGYGAGLAAIASTSRPATAPINCLGSACMAWRPYGYRIRHEGGVGPVHQGAPGALTEDLTAELVGYCGKAGRP